MSHAWLMTLDSGSQTLLELKLQQRLSARRLPIGWVCLSPQSEPRPATRAVPAMRSGCLYLPGYFAALRIPVIRGRDFNEQDGKGAPGVVLINETMAKRYWAGKDPIGQAIEIGRGIGPDFEDGPRRIIGYCRRHARPRFESTTPAHYDDPVGARTGWHNASRATVWPDLLAHPYTS